MLHYFMNRFACLACSKNKYKIGSNTLRQCSSCPSNSHTVSYGSSDVKMCICNVGYRGEPGGPCTGNSIFRIMQGPFCFA